MATKVVDERSASKPAASLDGPGFGPPLETEPRSSKKAKLLWVFGVTAVILMAIVILVAFKIYQNKVKAEQAFQADQATFAQVETDMATAYQAIVDKVGKPDSTKITKNCSHVSQVIGQGDLHCGVKYEMAYRETDYDYSNEHASQLQLAILSTNRYKVANNSTIPLKSSLNSNTWGFYSTLYTTINVSCGLHFQFGDLSLTGSSDLRTRGMGALYLFECDQVMQKPVYTLND